MMTPLSAALERFATVTARWCGSTLAFVLAASVVAVWAILGPAYDYSNSWQIAINTGTTIVTFLMVFLIQRAQNRDALAIQVKLNELLDALKEPDSRLAGAELMPEKKLVRIQEAQRKRRAQARRPDRRRR